VRTGAKGGRPKKGETTPRNDLPVRNGMEGRGEKETTTTGGGKERALIIDLVSKRVL